MYEDYNDVANYAIEIDPDVILDDYDNADAYIHEQQDKHKEDNCNIQFE